MSVVIIGNGGKLRAALEQVESQSITWTEERRTAAEELVNAQAEALSAICDPC